MGFLINWLIGSRLGRAVAGAVAALALLGGILAKTYHSGAQAAENKRNKQTIKRTEAGRDAVAKAKAETRDSTNADLVDRLRRNDGQW